MLIRRLLLSLAAILFAASAWAQNVAPDESSSGALLGINSLDGTTLARGPSGKLSATDLRVGTAQSSTYTLAYANSTVCSGGTDNGCLIAETGGSAITLNASTSAYFPPGAYFAVTVPIGYPPATIALGAGASWSSSTTAPQNSSGAVVVPSGAVVRVETSQTNTYAAMVEYGPNVDDTSFLENTGGNQFAGGNTLPPLSANWTTTSSTLSSTTTAGGPLGSYSVFAETTANAEPSIGIFTNGGGSGVNYGQYQRIIVVARPQGANTRYLSILIYNNNDSATLQYTLYNAAGNCLVGFTGSGGTNEQAALPRSFIYPNWTSWCVYEFAVNTGATGGTAQVKLFLNSSPTAGVANYTGDGSSGLDIAAVFMGSYLGPATNLVATVYNDAAAAGNLGQVIALNCPSVASQTATFSNGSANIVLATAAINVGCPINFTSTGTLPTNFSTSTNYYVLTLSTLTITVSAAPGGTVISAGSAGSGTQSGVGTGILITSSATVRNVGGVSLTAGNWLCQFTEAVTPASTMTILKRGVSQSSATLPAVTDPSYFATAASLTSADVEAQPLGIDYIQLSSTTEIYVINDDTSASTATGLANGNCWRPR